MSKFPFLFHEKQKSFFLKGQQKKKREDPPKRNNPTPNNIQSPRTKYQLQIKP